MICGFSHDAIYSCNALYCAVVSYCACSIAFIDDCVSRAGEMMYVCREEV